VSGWTVTHPAFAQAVTEIESLGFRVSENPGPDSIPYTVIGGRSNARWWLVPLANRKVAMSGMALFQPIIPSAKILKGAALMASSLGLSALWARKKLYISGKAHLADLFGENDLHYAFFTGTDSPHRKVAVQIMDKAGNIKGFAKVSRNPAIKPLLSYEAAILNDLRSLELQSAHIPTVLFSGERDGASLLVTDTLKTARTKTSICFNNAHRAFLHELAHKTAIPETGGKEGLVTELQRRYAAVVERLPVKWRHRIEQGFEKIAEQRDSLGPAVLCHGDFTPWNTFFVDSKLYVFDWEYADHIYPAGYDAIHFLLSLPKIKRQPAAEKIKRVLKELAEMHYLSDGSSIKPILLVYLCGHALQYMHRAPVEDGRILSWDGSEEIAVLIDTTIAMKD